MLDTYTPAYIPERQYYLMEKTLDQNQFALGTVLDIQGAFYNATFHRMCIAAERHELEPTIVKYSISLILESINTTAC